MRSMKMHGDQLKPIEATEGWQATLTPSTRVAHYIRNQMALCRRVGFYRADLVPHVAGGPKGNDDCITCFRAVEREAKITKKR